MKYIISCLHHIWASFEGSAEVYNEVQRTNDSIQVIKKFFVANLKGKVMTLVMNYLIEDKVEGSQT